MFFGVGYGMKRLGVRNDLALVLAGPAIYFLFSICMPRAIVTQEQTRIEREKLIYSAIGTFIGIVTVVVAVQGGWLSIMESNMQYLLFAVLGGIMGMLIGLIVHRIIRPNA